MYSHHQGSESSRLVKDRLNMLNSRTSREMNNMIDDQFKSQRQLGEGLKRESGSDLSREDNFNSQMTKENEQDQELAMSRKQLQESVQFQEDKLKRLEPSQIKARNFKNELESLEAQKFELEKEKA